jgi:hypothetical protein
MGGVGGKDSDRTWTVHPFILKNPKKIRRPYPTHDKTCILMFMRKKLTSAWTKLQFQKERERDLIESKFLERLGLSPEQIKEQKNRDIVNEYLKRVGDPEDVEYELPDVRLPR